MAMGAPLTGALTSALMTACSQLPMSTRPTM